MPEPTFEVRIAAAADESPRVRSFVLEPLSGPLPAFTAGSHVDGHLPAGGVRSYSLLNGPHERDRYVVAVALDAESRGGSRHIHGAWRVGQTVRISPPRNSFALAEDAAHSVFIAGGIGITPLLSMMARLDALGRSWELHYALRLRGEAAFLNRISRLGVADPKVHVSFHHEADATRLDVAAVVRGTPADAHLYCCGPARMLDAFLDATAGRPESHVHVEYFTSREAAATEGGYALVLRRSGRTVRVEPGQRMLDALLAAGVDVSYSCSEGVCGTCETRVLAGIPDHRDQFLSPDEQASNGLVMICCSGSKSPELVLDL